LPLLKFQPSYLYTLGSELTKGNNFLSAFQLKVYVTAVSMHISVVTAPVFIGHVLKTDSDNSATQYRIK